MALREEFAVVGAFLFRWRSYLPLAVLALILSQSDRAHGSRAFRALCLGTAIVGLTIRAYVAGHAPRGTTGRNTRSQECKSPNTTGAYSVVRHPMYLGNFFIWIGVSLFPQKWWLTLLVALVFWLYYERIMYVEEEFLRGKFGRGYLEWAAKTPAFVPDLRRFQPPGLPFSTRAFLRREYSGHFAVIMVFTLFELTGDWVADGKIALDPFWTSLSISGALVYVTVLLLKRQTDWLDVPGR